MASFQELVNNPGVKSTDEIASKPAATSFKSIVGPAGLPKTPYDDLMKEASSQYGVPYPTLYRLIKRESGFDPKAENPESSAAGLGQFIDSTAKELGITDKFDPKQAVPGAARYLKQHYDRFKDWKLAVAAYHSGPGAVSKAKGIPSNVPKGYIESIIPDATPAEVKEVKKIATSFQELVDQPMQPVEVPATTSPTEVAEVPETSAERFYSAKAFGAPIQGMIPGIQHPAISAHMYKTFGTGPKPGGVDEFGRLTDEEGEPYFIDKPVNPNSVKGAIAGTLKGLSGFAEKPMESIKGVAEFFLQVPAFMMGLIGAASRGGGKLIDQLARMEGEEYTDPSGEKLPGVRVPLNLSDIYDAMSGGMQEALEAYQPVMDSVAETIGPPTEQSQMVGEVAMAPLTGLSMIGNKVASYEGFRDYPNVQGASRILGDSLGFLVMGMIMKGPRRKAEFARELEEIVVDADKIVKAEEALKTAPQDVVNIINQKKVAIEKQRLEGKAAGFARKFKDDMLITEEIARQTEEVAKAKLRPVADTGLKKPKVEEVVEPKKIKSFKKLEKAPEEVPDVKPSEKIDYFGEGEQPKPKVEVITEVDRQTGTEAPMLDSEINLYLNPKKKVDQLHQLFEERIKSVMEDPEVYTQKLINDVNRWYYGDDAVNIGAVRDQLSNMATRAGELRELFLTGRDHAQFIENVSEAASWARRIDRNILAESEGIKLHAGLPISEAVEQLKKVTKSIKGRIIKSVNSSESQILKDIAQLHTEGKFDADITYSKGAMWKGTGIKPKHKFDLRTEAEGVTIADVGKSIPLKDSSIGSVMFDPPFIIHSTGKKVGAMGERFTTFKSVDELWQFHRDAIGESFRVLKPGGKLVVKIKDLSTHGQLIASSSEVYNSAISSGFKPISRFIYTPKRMLPLPPHVKKQMTPRVAHVDYWIFEKPKKSFKYPSSGGVQLNMMIPLDQMPDFVRLAARKIFKGAKRVNVNKLYRNKELFDKTGHWLGRDGKWRYHIGMKDTKIDFPVDLPYGQTVPLSSVFKNEKLFRAVPELSNTRIGRINEVSSRYNKRTDVIELGTSAFRPGKLRRKIAHESQHATNKKTGAFPGSSIQKAGSLEKYWKVPGEMESRLAEATSRMSDAELRRTPPWEILDKMLKVEGRGGKGTELYSGLPIDKILSSEAVKSSALRVPHYFKRKLKFFGNQLREFRYIPKTEEFQYKNPNTNKWQKVSDNVKEALMADERILDNITDPGQTLYSGAEYHAIVKGIKGVSDYVKEARRMKAFKPKAAAKMGREEFVRAVVDRSGNIRRELLKQLSDKGYEIVQRMYLSKGASARAANELKQMSKEVYSGLTRDERRILDTVILTDRLIDIAKYKSPKQFKLPKKTSLTSLVGYRELFQRIEKISPEKAADISRRASLYFDWMKKPLKEMLDAELITQKEFDALASHNYRRIKLVDVYDKRYGQKLGGTKKTVYDSGVESLQRGRETDIYEPSSEVMALEVFNRAYGRILNNAANKSLLELAQRDNTNPFVRVKNKDTKIPSDWSRIFVYDKGKRKSIHISPEMGKEWITQSPEISYKMGQILRWGSGAPILRTFATGINWGFALANLPRDVMHSWAAARTFEGGKWKLIYNPNAPIAMTQIGRDLATVFTDAALRGKRYQQYIKEGGGMEFLVHQGRLFQRGKHIGTPLDRIYDFMGYFGETSELMTRLAIRERVMRRGKSSQEATFAARDYMDFAQGGWATKVADNGIPYLSASVQGTRGLWRALKDNPVESAYKLSQFAAFTTGIYVAAKALHPKTMENLQGNIDMQNNLVIPLGDSFGFEDEFGQTRYPYVKIPLDPSQKFFKTFFEASADKWLGNEVDVDRVVDSLKEQSPVGVTELPPTVSGLVGYATNKDFWLNEDIWRYTDKPFTYPNSKEEYIPGRTPEVYKDFGQLTGLSPERTRYAVEELTTSGTVWSALLNKGYDELFSDLPKEKKEQHLAMVLARTPVFKRFIGVTNPYSKHVAKADKAEEAATLDKFVENREMDTLVDGYLYGDSAKLKDIVTYAKSFKDRDTYDRLMDRFKWEKAIKDLPEKSFWRRMKGMPSIEAKASLFVDRLSKAKDEERKQLWKEYRIVSRAGGVISEGFREEVRKQIVSK